MEDNCFGSIYSAVLEPQNGGGRDLCFFGGRFSSFLFFLIISTRDFCFFWEIFLLIFDIWRCFWSFVLFFFEYFFGVVFLFYFFLRFFLRFFGVFFWDVFVDFFFGGGGFQNHEYSSRL